MNEQDLKGAMKEFIDNRSRVLITTDIISQGIHIHQVKFVINYDLPIEIEQYIHRVGHAVQYGKKSIAVNIVSESDVD